MKGWNNDHGWILSILTAVGQQLVLSRKLSVTLLGLICAVKLNCTPCTRISIKFRSLLTIPHYKGKKYSKAFLNHIYGTFTHCFIGATIRSKPLLKDKWGSLTITPAYTRFFGLSAFVCDLVGNKEILRKQADPPLHRRVGKKTCLSIGLIFANLLLLAEIMWKNENANVVVVLEAFLGNELCEKFSGSRLYSTPANMQYFNWSGNSCQRLQIYRKYLPGPAFFND